MKLNSNLMSLRNSDAIRVYESMREICGARELAYLPEVGSSRRVPKPQAFYHRLSKCSISLLLKDESRESKKIKTKNSLK